MCVLVGRFLTFFICSLSNRVRPILVLLPDVLGVGGVLLVWLKWIARRRFFHSSPHSRLFLVFTIHSLARPVCMFVNAPTKVAWSFPSGIGITSDSLVVCCITSNSLCVVFYTCFFLSRLAPVPSNATLCFVPMVFLQICPFLLLFLACVCRTSVLLLLAVILPTHYAVLVPVPPFFLLFSVSSLNSYRWYPLNTISFVSVCVCFCASVS